MKHTQRLDRLRRRVDARHGRKNDYERQERERLEALTEEQRLRNLARLAHRLGDWPPDGPPTQNYRIADVDAMIDAGDLEGAWEFLAPHCQAKIEYLRTEV